MAKGNMLQGQATGKVGDIVFMVRNGQQISRVYTSAGGRSGAQASIAVRRQRVRFGAASNQYLLYRNIVRGMYRTGKNTKQSDYNFFVRENVDLLPYLTKEENAAGVKCAMPGTFSRGTLGSINYDLIIAQEDSDPLTYEIKSPNQFAAAVYALDNTVAELKAALKVAYPNARKVNFSVCSILAQELSLPQGSQWSHTFVREDVVFDLYEEDSAVQDTATIAAYFHHYCSNQGLLDAIDAGEVSFLDGFDIFKVESETASFLAAANYLYIPVFATNDQVGDAYTSTLGQIVVPDSDGGLSLYDSLRTNNHRQVAEDSYGYSTGVMRTNIQQA